MRSLALLVLCHFTASMSVLAQTVVPSDPCAGICTNGPWVSQTVTTTVTRIMADNYGDNRPKSPQTACTITVSYRKRVCVQETPPDARVSVIIDGVCSDCPKSAQELLELAIVRALVIDDPFGLRQPGMTETAVTFSTKRCWAVLYCNESYCARPCDCSQPTVSQGSSLPSVCDVCCLTMARIRDDGRCNITSRFSNGSLGGSTDDHSCSDVSIAPPCDGQAIGGVMINCIETCPDLYYRGNL